MSQERRSKIQVLPLRPEQELERFVSQVEEKFSDLNKKQRKPGCQSIDLDGRDELLDVEQGDEISYDEVRDFVSGCRGSRYLIHFNRDGEREVEELKGRKKPWEDVFDYLFYPFEMQEAYTFNVRQDGEKLFQEGVFAAGYDHRETVSYGPDNKFEGPRMVYMAAVKGKKNENTWNTTDDLAGMIHHPQSKLVEYREDMDGVTTVDGILQQPPEEIV